MTWFAKCRRKFKNSFLSFYCKDWTASNITIFEKEYDSIFYVMFANASKVRLESKTTSNITVCYFYTKTFWIAMWLQLKIFMVQF